MKKYRIVRPNCRDGIIYQKMWDGSEEPIMKEAEPYEKCLQYVTEHQKDLKVFKVGSIGNRKNASRHLDMKIYAEDEKEACKWFRKYCEQVKDIDDKDRTLYTGDWKEVRNEQG